jgi:PAS domain S-box-containing protein
LAKVGMSFEMLSGKYISDFLSEDELAALDYQEIWSQLEKGHISTRIDKFVFYTKAFWFRITYTPIRDINDEFYKVIALFEDITEQIEKEQTLQTELERQRIILQRLQNYES